MRAGSGPTNASEAASLAAEPIDAPPRFPLQVDCDRVLAATPDSMLDRTGSSVLGGLSNRTRSAVVGVGRSTHTGFELALLKLADRYPNVPILVAEFGLGNRDILEPDCTVHDDYRIAYHRDHIAAMGRAVDQGANVPGYLCVQLYPGPTRGLNAGSVLAARLGGKPRAADQDVRPSPPVI